MSPVPQSSPAIITFLLQLLCWLSDAPAVCVQTLAPTVKSHGATYIGVSNSIYNVESWLSIRYAKPPNDAQESGFAYFQMAELGSDLLALPQSEDCLSLTITRPSGVSSAKLVPVFVWIHGGAFNTGSELQVNLDSIVNTSSEVHKPIIAVKINYRLNFFGFSAGTTIESRGGTNLGLFDQRLALQWIKDNIEAFGGDPNKLTIAGESAGGNSVGLQMVAYSGRDDGLFRGAIIQSGAVDSITNFRPPSYADYETTWKGVVNATGCTNTTDPFVCVQNVPQARMFDTISAFGRSVSAGLSFFPWVVVLDGTFVQDFPSVLLAKKKIVKVPLINGFTTDEMTYYVPTNLNISSDAEIVSLGKSLSSDVPLATIEEIVALDTLAEFPDVGTGGIDWKRTTAIVSDGLMRCPGRATSLNLTASNVWKYRFNAIVPDEYNRRPWLGVVHGSDLPYAFGASNSGTNHTIDQPIDLALSEVVQKAWVSFVADLDPNSVGDVAPGLTWPKYSVTDPKVMVFQTSDGAHGPKGQGNHVEADSDNRPACDYLMAHDADFLR